MIMIALMVGILPMYFVRPAVYTSILKNAFKKIINKMIYISFTVSYDLNITRCEFVNCPLSNTSCKHYLHSHF